MIRFLHGSYGPTPTDDRMGFEQFHRAVGVHLGGDDRTQIFLQINGVDGRLGAVGVIAYLECAGELLVFTYMLRITHF